MSADTHLEGENPVTQSRDFIILSNKPPIEEKRTKTYEQEKEIASFYTNKVDIKFSKKAS